ncbi:MAG: CHAT domain-containing protein, partial [Planctomycetota bacterium]
EDEHLPAVGLELDMLERSLPGAVSLRGPEATRDAILAALPRRRLVHVAGHARAREDRALLSALRVRDGWIAAADLGEGDLGGSLVVLSACRTGDPSLRWQGEAMGGFPRALLAAGASGLVASRWEVPDAVAHEWMRRFYDRLKGKQPDQALNRAARAMRRDHPHPADWAAFLMIQPGR